MKHLVHEGAKLDVVDNAQRTPLVKAVLSGSQNPKLTYPICVALLDGGADACKIDIIIFFKKTFVFVPFQLLMQ